MEKIILEMRNITKLFPGVKALSEVNLEVAENEIHALCGENGAGKSTLMNILSGVYGSKDYEGDIVYNGEICKFSGIKESEAKGIAIIHQELALVSNLSVAENIFLGNENAKNGIIGWNETFQKAKELTDRVGFKGSVREKIINTSVGEQQLIEIAKALSKDVKLLILDEPTSALNETDAGHLLELLLTLKSVGMTCIIISHKLNEIKRIADKITILRDGKVIETLDNKTDNVTQERIIQGMVGREILDIYPSRSSHIGDEMFSVKSWNVYDVNAPTRKVLKNISFHVNKGEVIGLSGLMGAGRTELALSLFGKSFGVNITGEIFKDKQAVKYSNCSDAIKNGVAYVTEDRKACGLILSEDIRDNIVLASLAALGKSGIRNNTLEIRSAKEQSKKLNIRSSSIYQKTVNLSGGNQQKVVLARWILSLPDILILDEPTRGIDVGAKREIYNIINGLADEGKSIIFISSEMEELLGMCDRIYVMNEGCIVGELGKNQFSQEAVMECIMQSNTVGGKE